MNNQQPLWADEACLAQDAPRGRRKNLLGNEILCEDRQEVTEEGEMKDGGICYQKEAKVLLGQNLSRLGDNRGPEGIQVTF